MQFNKLIEKILFEAEPKKGTGKKPKGSSRRLYTDENTKDTVKVKFSSVQDIRDTLNKSSFKSKPHARQSQIINLIHQRVRVAKDRVKDPAKKKRLTKAFEYISKRKEASRKKTLRLKESTMYAKGKSDGGLEFGTREDFAKTMKKLERMSMIGGIRASGLIMGRAKVAARNTKDTKKKKHLKSVYNRLDKFNDRLKGKREKND